MRVLALLERVVEIVYQERNQVTCEVAKSTRNAAYPSDSLSITFGDAACDEVQIAINARGNVYVECVDIDGNEHRIELGKAE